MHAAYWEDFEENIEYACQGRQSSTVHIGDLNVVFGNTQTGSAHPYIASSPVLAYRIT